MSTYIYRIGLMSFDFSYSTAIGLVNSVINLMLLFTVNAISRATTKTSLF